MARINLIKYGFKRNSENDFVDDGNHFKFYCYKGLPISYLKSEGEYYLDLRLDYIGVKYEEYKEDLKILEEFNGCTNIDIEKLIKNCEYIIKKYNIKEA